MATFSQNQVKDILVGCSLKDYSDVSTFITSASALDFQVFSADGSTSTASAGLDTYFIQKHKDGSTKTSDIIPGDKIKYFKKVTPKTEVLGSVAITVPASAVVVGDILQVTIVLDNWGSRSFEDQYFKYGTTKVVTGDTPTTLAAKLVTSLTQNFSREPGKLFTFTSAAGVITITEVAQDYVTGKKQGKNLEFTVNNDFDGTQVKTQRVINPGSGKNVRDMEYFFKGNVGDSYRGAGYPHNFEEWYDSDLSTDYFLFEIGFWYEGDNHAVQKSEKQLIVAACQESDVDDLVTFYGVITG